MLRAVVLVLLSGAFPLVAADLYSARVPVPPGDEAAQRARGLGAALQVVVRQVTGDPQGAASPALAPEYDSAARYAREYRFVDTPRGLELEAAFEPGAVDAMLRRYGLAPRKDRPSVLAWLAGPGEGGDRLLLAEPDAGLWEALDDAAVGNGLTLLVPLLDLEDQMALPPADISARVATTVRDASVRYEPDAVVSAYLSGAGDLWQADWMLLSGETVRRWSTRGESRPAALAAGMRDVAGIMAALFPVSRAVPLDLRVPGVASSAATDGSLPSPAVPGMRPAPPGLLVPPDSVSSVTPIAAGEGEILVRIAGIGGPGDYGRAMGIFRDQPAIVRFKVLAAEPDAVVVAVTPSGGQQAVAAALEASGAVQGEPSGATIGLSRGISLYYRLTP
jgi:hypothetical protein